MKIKVNRLIVAILTFKIGVSVALYVQYLQHPSILPATIENAKTLIPVSETPQSKIALRCDDKLLRQISEELLQDDDFVGWIRSRDTKVFDCSENFRLEKIDLNRDRKPEFIVQGINLNLCTVTGNCSFWIYAQNGDGYISLMEVENIQRYRMLQKTRNGYRDVLTYRHNSAFDSDLSVLRFNGKHYDAEDCSTYSYSYLDKQGRFHELKKPIITSRICD